MSATNVTPEAAELVRTVLKVERKGPGYYHARIDDCAYQIDRFGREWSYREIFSIHPHFGEPQRVDAERELPDLACRANSPMVMFGFSELDTVFQIV